MEKNKLSILSGVLFLTGCSVNVTPFPSGGSKSDGIINMTYNVNEFQSAVIDWEEVKKQAKSKCVKWGYKDAEPFGGETEKCIGDCFEYEVIIPYQCLD